MRNLIIAAVAGVCLIPLSAAAQQRCQDYRAFLAEALARYGEVPVSMALSQRGHTTLMLANRETGTWTAIARRPDGCTVVLDHGEAWSAIEAPEDGEAS